MTLATAGPSLLPASLPVTPDPELPIRLIALDIDGTIIGDDHDIADHERRTFNLGLGLVGPQALAVGRIDRVQRTVEIADEDAAVGHVDQPQP